MSGRRGFLAGLTAGAVAGGVTLPTVARAAQPHPDAALIKACAEYLRMQRAFEAACSSPPDDIEPGHPALAILAPISRLVETIVALRATTAEGYLARARCAAYGYLPSNSGCRDDPKAAGTDRFNAAARRDLVQMERGAAA